MESWRVNVDWLVRKRGVLVKKELTEIYLEELNQRKEKEITPETVKRRRENNKEETEQDLFGEQSEKPKPKRPKTTAANPAPFDAEI